MKGQTISIKRATISDVGTFAFIKAEAYKDDREKTKLTEDEKPIWYYGEWYVGLGKVDEVEANRLIQNNDCYLILSDRQTIGCLWINKDSDSSLTIEDFCILPAFQGRGIGTITLKLIEQQYPANKIWKLDTPNFCVRNIHLYEKVGYVQVGKASNDTVTLFEKHID